MFFFKTFFFVFFAVCFCKSTILKPVYNRILKSRNDLGDYLQIMGTDFNVGIEIGVQTANFSKKILDKWSNNRHFYLVDVWAPLINYHDSANVPLNEQNSRFNQAKKNLLPFRQKTHFIKQMSSTAAKMFQKQKIRFDFVYIDARHDYCSVREDITLYFNLLKHGGIISGHDYFYDETGFSICPNGTKIEGSVKRAVDEFAKSNGYVVNIIGDSWLIFKP